MSKQIHRSTSGEDEPMGMIVLCFRKSLAFVSGLRMGCVVGTITKECYKLMNQAALLMQFNAYLSIPVASFVG